MTSKGKDKQLGEEEIIQLDNGFRKIQVKDVSNKSESDLGANNWESSVLKCP